MNFFLANAWRASLSMETNGTYSLPLTRNLFKNRKKKKENNILLYVLGHLGNFWERCCGYVSKKFNLIFFY
jgi:uroporphyrinogen-III decarboxylase